MNSLPSKLPKAVPGRGSQLVSTAEITLFQTQAAASPFVVYGYIDLSAMASSDVFTFKIYITMDMFNYRQLDSLTFSNAQTNTMLKIAQSSGTVGNAIKVTGIRTGGSDRTFPWNYTLVYGAA
jgi:hypothetical protein